MTNPYSLTLNSTSPQKEYVQIGPSMVRAISPPWSRMVKEGAQRVQSCSTVPMTVPGGDCTSMRCRQHGKQADWQFSGRSRYITS